MRSQARTSDRLPTSRQGPQQRQFRLAQLTWLLCAAACSPEASGPGYTSGSGSTTTGGPRAGFASYAAAANWIGSTCGVNNCHANRYPPTLANFDLDYLKVSLTQYPIERCGNIPLVVPGNPDASAMPMAVRGVCGDLLMPFGCATPPEAPCISDAELENLRLWIAQSDPFL